MSEALELLEAGIYKKSVEIHNVAWKIERYKFAKESPDYDMSVIKKLNKEHATEQLNFKVLLNRYEFQIETELRTPK